MKESITQEDSMGCGAACVAFISGQKYQNSVEVLGIHKAKTVGYHLKELIDGLEYFGITSYFRHLKPKSKSDTYRQGAIVFIKRSARYPYGHYLARHNDTWMDPWINLPFDKDIKNAKSGYRKRLPGKAQYVIYQDK
jgi:hypothetical protein